MFLTGVTSLSIVLAGSMANEWIIDGQFSSLWNISQYGLMPAVYCFIAIAAIGLAIAVWGLLIRKISNNSNLSDHKTGGEKEIS